MSGGHIFIGFTIVMLSVTLALGHANIATSIKAVARACVAK